MDDLDKKILELLQDNSRLSITEISKTINLSRPSVSERMTRLIDEGIIEQFTTIIPPAKIGHGVSFFVEISSIKVPVEKVVELLKQNPHVTEIHCVTGTINYVVKVSMPGISMMNIFLTELMKYCHVVTSVILHSPIPHRNLKPL